MDITQCIKDIISLRSRSLQFFQPDELPDDIPEWIMGHGTEVEITALMCTFFFLLRRGADPDDCARYAVDGTVSLPFAGCEEHLVKAIFASIRKSGHSELRVAQLVELLCLAGEGVSSLIREPTTAGKPVSGIARTS